MNKPAATKTKEPELFEPGKAAKPAKKQAVARVKPAPSPAPRPRSMLEVIAEAVANPACDVEKMKALLDMQERIEANEAKKQFTDAFIALQAALPSIRRDGKIEIREKDSQGRREGRVQQATPYATFNEIHKALKPLLVSHGFTLAFSTEPSSDLTRIMVRGILEHRGGYSRETVFPLPAETSGSKNNVQGWGSSMSYGKRYCTIALLNIVSHAEEDRDLDGRAAADVQVELVSEDQALKLRDAIEACGVGTEKFCQKYKIEKVTDLPASLFGSAVKACDHYAKSVKNG